MGAYSQVIIGVKVSADDVFTTKKVKAFNHNFPDTMKFSPENGKPLWENKKVFILDGFDPDSNTYEKIENLSVLNDNFYDNDIEEYFIGIKLKDTHEEGTQIVFSEIPNLVTLKSKLQKVLVPFGIWDESTFGIYSILKYS